MLFLVDLDGTLLNAKGKLEKEDIGRIIKIQESGHTVVICTGRTEKEAKSIISELEIEKYRGIVILADGQYIIDYATDTKYQQNFLCDKDIIDIYNGCPQYKDEDIHVFCDNKIYRIVSSVLSSIYIKTKIKRLLGYKNDNTSIITEHMLTNMTIQQAEKMTISSDNDKFSNSILLDKYEIYYVHDKKRFEIKCKGVNKASAVICAIKHRNYYGSSIQAFGNDDNDICLFNIADVSYAVADATDSVKKNANYVLEPIRSAVTQKMIENCMKER